MVLGEHDAPIAWDEISSTAEELLPEPDRPGLSRRRVTMVGAVLVVLAVLAGARLATAHGDKQSADSSPLDRSATIGPSPVDVTIGRPNALKDDPAHCPDTIACTSVDTVPDAVTAAVRKYLLGAQPRAHFSVTQTRPVYRLYYRQLKASSGDLNVLVIVSRAARHPDAEPTEATDDPPGESVGFVQVVTPDGFLVQVQFTGPPGWHPPMYEIRALAADTALLTLD